MFILKVKGYPQPNMGLHFISKQSLTLIEFTLSSFLWPKQEFHMGKFEWYMLIEMFKDKTYFVLLRI